MQLISAFNRRTDYDYSAVRKSTSSNDHVKNGDFKLIQIPNPTKFNRSHDSYMLTKFEKRDYNESFAKLMKYEQIQDLRKTINTFSSTFTKATSIPTPQLLKTNPPQHLLTKTQLLELPNYKNLETTQHRLLRFPTESADKKALLYNIMLHCQSIQNVGKDHFQLLKCPVKKMVNNKIKKEMGTQYEMNSNSADLLIQINNNELKRENLDAIENPTLLSFFSSDQKTYVYHNPEDAKCSLLFTDEKLKEINSINTIPINAQTLLTTIPEKELFAPVIFFKKTGSPVQMVFDDQVAHSVVENTAKNASVHKMPTLRTSECKQNKIPHADVVSLETQVDKLNALDSIDRRLAAIDRAANRIEQEYARSTEMIANFLDMHVRTKNNGIGDERTINSQSLPTSDENSYLSKVKKNITSAKLIKPLRTISPRLETPKQILDQIDRLSSTGIHCPRKQDERLSTLSKPKSFRQTVLPRQKSSQKLTAQRVAPLRRELQYRLAERRRIEAKQYATSVLAELAKPLQKRTDNSNVPSFVRKVSTLSSRRLSAPSVESLRKPDSIKFSTKSLKPKPSVLPNCSKAEAVMKKTKTVTTPLTSLQKNTMSISKVAINRKINAPNVHLQPSYDECIQGKLWESTTNKNDCVSEILTERSSENSTEDIDWHKIEEIIQEY